MERIPMNEEAIDQMLSEQKKMYLQYENLTEEDIKIDRDGFFKRAKEIGWDIEIDHFVEVLSEEVGIENANLQELSKFYQEIIGEDTEGMQNFGYLKIMVDNAKEKQKLLGKTGEHFSLFFHEDELRKFVKENGVTTFKLPKSEYYARFGKPKNESKRKTIARGKSK